MVTVNSWIFSFSGNVVFNVIILTRVFLTRLGRLTNSSLFDRWLSKYYICIMSVNSFTFCTVHLYLWVSLSITTVKKKVFQYLDLLVQVFSVPSVWWRTIWVTDEVKNQKPLKINGLNSYRKGRSTKVKIGFVYPSVKLLSTLQTTTK